MAASAWVVEVADTEFESAVIERSGELPVVVDFWAPWCEPCRVLGPLLERLAIEADGAWLLAKVDVEQAPQVATAFAVQSIPLVVALRDGKIVGEFSGVRPEAELREFLAGLGPSEADRLLEATQGASVDPAAAEAQLREVLALEPARPDALSALAALLVDRGDLAAAEDLLEAAGDGGDSAEDVARTRARIHLARRAAEFGPLADAEARVTAAPGDRERLYELGCVLAHSGDPARALACLLRAAQQDKTFARERVRETMVQIFYLVGARSELADDYRSKLSSVLY